VSRGPPQRKNPRPFRVERKSDYDKGEEYWKGVKNI